MMTYFIILVSSFIIGSFLNVLIYRLPRNESIVRPGSHCIVCGHDLRVLDLVPLISYVCLRGKCRYCGVEIKPQYPVVEILTGLLFLAIYHKWGISLRLLEGCIFTAILIAAAFSDLNEGIIPNSLTYPGFLMGLIIAFFSPGIGTALGGAVFFSGVFLIMAVLFQGGMGGGDIKLAAVIGIFTGLQGAVMVFVLSSLLGAVWVLPLLLTGKANRKTGIKFGPFLAVAAWVVWMYEPEILNVYWQFLIQK